MSVAGDQVKIFVLGRMVLSTSPRWLIPLCITQEDRSYPMKRAPQDSVGNFSKTL